jgi:hypothetical protein
MKIWKTVRLEFCADVDDCKLLQTKLNEAEETGWEVENQHFIKLNNRGVMLIVLSQKVV